MKRRKGEGRWRGEMDRWRTEVHWWDRGGAGGEENWTGMVRGGVEGVDWAGGGFGWTGRREEDRFIKSDEQVEERGELVEERGGQVEKRQWTGGVDT